MTNNTPDYEDNLYFDCKNCKYTDEYCASGDCNRTQANDLACNKISLTEQWKKGELPDGVYYCKLILNNMKPSVERCKAHCIPMGVSADKGEEVLAPVPSYDEWQASYNCMLENEVLRLKNAQLKELLKECRDVLYLLQGETVDFPHTVDDMITKIDEVLK